MIRRVMLFLAVGVIAMNSKPSVAALFSGNDYTISAHNEQTGKLITSFPISTDMTMRNIHSLDFGPNGSLYVARPGHIDVYNPTTGSRERVLSIQADNIKFGTDGNLYASHSYELSAYNPITGSQILDSPILENPPYSSYIEDIAFDGIGTLYSLYSNFVYSHEHVGGEWSTTGMGFITPSSSSFAFSPNGNLFLAE